MKKKKKDKLLPIPTDIEPERHLYCRRFHKHEKVYIQKPFKLTFEGASIACTLLMPHYFCETCNAYV